MFFNTNLQKKKIGNFSNSLKNLYNSYTLTTLLPIGIFEKFFHWWKADIMAGHCGRRLMALRRPLQFYAGKSRRAGVFSETLCALNTSNTVVA